MWIKKWKNLVRDGLEYSKKNQRGAFYEQFKDWRVVGYEKKT